jgi:hypothetical protein
MSKGCNISNKDSPIVVLENFFIDHVFLTFSDEIYMNEMWFDHSDRTLQ